MKLAGPTAAAKEQRKKQNKTRNDGILQKKSFIHPYYQHNLPPVKTVANGKMLCELDQALSDCVRDKRLKMFSESAQKCLKLFLFEEEEEEKEKENQENATMRENLANDKQ